MIFDDNETQKEGEAMSEADAIDIVAVDDEVWVIVVDGDGAPDGDAFSVGIGVAVDDAVEKEVTEASAETVAASLDVPPNTDLVAFTESVGVAPEEEDRVSDCDTLIDATAEKDPDSE